MMDSALLDLGRVAELLAVAARSVSVRGWDERTLSRAFRWARRVEHVSSRLRDDPAARSALEAVNAGLRAAFPGHAAVSLSDLSRCRRLLRAGLLGNPELPASLLQALVRDDVTDAYDHVVRLRSACRLLGAQCACELPASAHAQAALLLQRLGALLSPSRGTSLARSFLDDVPRGSRAEVEHLCQVMAAALLTADSSDERSQTFLLDWLERQPDLLQDMCSSLPANVLRDLATKHPAFGDVYCAVLRGWAKDMEYSLDQRGWVAGRPTMTFSKLAEHLQLLFQARPSFREEVEGEVAALKISGPGLQGLSVWRDILLDIQKVKKRTS